MKLCFSTLGCPDWDIIQVAEKGAAYGFDGVELRISGNRHVDPALTKDERKKIKKMFAAHNLTIAIISGYTLFCGDDEILLKENEEALLKNIELAADLGAPYLRSFLGENGCFTEAGVETLRRACAKAYESGVTVLLEIHDALKDGKMAAQLVRQVNSLGLAVLWDIHHSLNNKEAPEETWRHAGKYIKHVHMKDADANDEICLMGDGILVVRDVVQTLSANGFDGFLSFEWEKTWIPKLQEPEVALPGYVAHMKKLMGET
ncbi:MAG: sugar phosphate isomerase/epimerase [Defluviitaleaceae bacterium]|nr:sugar phosphate isomerase/epimerase [Defluviitaleaceae bacterium]